MKTDSYVLDKIVHIQSQQKIKSKWFKVKL